MACVRHIGEQVINAGACVCHWGFIANPGGIQALFDGFALRSRECGGNAAASEVINNLADLPPRAKAAVLLRVADVQNMADVGHIQLYALVRSGQNKQHPGKLRRVIKISGSRHIGADKMHAVIVIALYIIQIFAGKMAAQLKSPAIYAANQIRQGFALRRRKRFAGISGSQIINQLHNARRH